MPFIIPIQSGEDAAEPAAVFAGSTDLQATATVNQSLAAVVAGSTALQASSTVELTESVNLAGATDLLATGRLNDEVNVFGAANLQGSTALQANGLVGLWSGTIFFDGSTDLRATGIVTTAEEEGEPSFVFIVDVHNPAATAALARNVRRFSVRLLVNGSPVPIKSATLNAPPDTLGTELNVELARPDAALVPLDASVDFELGIWTGAAFAFERLLTGARLSGRSKRIVNAGNLPTDTVALSFVDIVGDRWNLAPQAQTLVYDPDKIDAPDTESPAGSTLLIRETTGETVATISTAVPDLTLYEVLRLAYVEGCGFEEVKTNLPNFPVEQVSFTLTGGYDAGVRPLLSPFSPVVFAVGNVLWIVDPDATLPAGLTPKALTVSRLVEITSTLPNREPVDGLLARIKSDAIPGEYVTERLETEPPVEAGTFGTSSFTTTTTERRIREYRTTDNPAVIRREEVASLKTTVEDWQFNVISRETQTDQFDGLNRKTGHRKSVEARLPDPEADGALSLMEASRETQNIHYGAHPLKPTVDTILRIVTVSEGQILVDSDNQYLGEDFKSPLTEAHRSGNVETSGQTLEFGALKTKYETLAVRGQSVEMETRIVNHLSNAPDLTSTTTRPGSAEIERKSQATQTILLTLPGVTRTRRLAEFDGTGLPSATALDLANRELRKLSSPPLEFAGVLAFPDRSLRRGSVVAISERAAAALGVFIATGFKMDFANTNDALAITARLTARQVTTL
jgi:hypothetical protein